MINLLSHPIYYILFLTPVLFSSCGLGVNSIEVPIERPSSIISGSGSGEFLKKSQIQVYALANSPNEYLGSGEINEEGQLILELTAPSQFILVQASEGVYIEPSSGMEILLPEGYVLTTVAKYQTGEALQVELTPFTHLATSLIRYNLSKGMSIETAYQQATDLFTEWLGFDVFHESALPLDPSIEVIPEVVENGQEPSMESGKVSGNLRYRLFLYALSELSAWHAKNNGYDKPDVYNTLSVLEVMNKDIVADGLLDGMGLNDENELMPLALGIVILTPDSYRMGFAQQLIFGSKDQAEFDAVEAQSIIDIAKQLAENPAFLLTEKEIAIDLAAYSPSFNHHFEQTSVNEDAFNIVVDIETESIIQSVTISVDGDNGVEGRSMVIDPALFASNEISVLITVVDIFGNQSQQQVFIDFEKIIARFSNTYLEIRSPSITNKSTYPIEGIFRGENVASITILGIEMDIEIDDNNGGSWQGKLPLTPGLNILDVIFHYYDEFRHSTTAEIILDQIPPVVHLDNPHGKAKYQTEIRPLEDVNEAPIIVESNKLDLDGVLIERVSLDTYAIPYFAFTVSDAGDLRELPNTTYDVRYRYYKDNVAQGEERPLVLVNGEYLIPLVTETLHPDWYKANRVQLHSIRVEVRDPAGNITEQEFSFKADILVPAIEITYSIDDALSLFDTTSFTERDQLSGAEYLSMRYSFENITDGNINIRLEDSDEHLLTRDFKKRIRENIYEKETQTVWRAGIIATSVFDDCPVVTSVSAMETVTSVWNYTGPEIGWKEEYLPEPTVERISVDFDFDDLPENEPATEWEDASKDFDQIFASNTYVEDNKEVSYEYDFLSSDVGFNSVPYFVKDWKFFIYNEEGNIETQAVCSKPEMSNFQKMYQFVNQTLVGYPKNSSTNSKSKEIFNTSGFDVFDLDANAYIEETDDLFLIPVAHHVVIIKKVKTPMFDNFDDSDVFLSDEEFSSYTAIKYDNSISWRIRSNLEITTAVDAGLENIGFMSERIQSISENDVTYELTR